MCVKLRLILFRYIKSSHDKKKIVYNNYIYLKDKNSNDKVIFKCEKFYKFKCRARLHIQDDEIVKEAGDHNHNISNIKANDILNTIKNKAVTTRDSPSTIICISSIGASFQTSADLPSITLLKKTINRKRKNNDVLPNPLNTIDLVLPEDICKTYLNEDFCLYDTGSAELRILIFGTQQNLSKLESCKHWYMDGTFQSCPSLFYQLFTIHGKYIYYL